MKDVNNRQPIEILDPLISDSQEIQQVSPKNALGTNGQSTQSYDDL